MNKAAAIGLGGLLLAFPVHAGKPDPFAYKFEMTPEEGPVDAAIEKRYTAAFDKCQKAAVSTQQNLACLHDEFARQDGMLNRVWRATLARIVPDRRPSLKVAERRWATERDGFCKSKSDEFRGGTIQPVIYLDCRVEQTIRRTMWLSALR